MLLIAPGEMRGYLAEYMTEGKKEGPARTPQKTFSKTTNFFFFLLKGRAGLRHFSSQLKKKTKSKRGKKYEGNVPINVMLYVR